MAAKAPPASAPVTVVVTSDPTLRAEIGLIVRARGNRYAALTTVSTSSDPTLSSNIMDLINGKIAAALSAVTAARLIVGSKASAIVTTPPDPPGAPTK